VSSIRRVTNPRVAFSRVIGGSRTPPPPPTPTTSTSSTSGEQRRSHFLLPQSSISKSIRILKEPHEHKRSHIHIPAQRLETSIHSTQTQTVRIHTYNIRKWRANEHTYAADGREKRAREGGGGGKEGGGDNRVMRCDGPAGAGASRGALERTTPSLRRRRLHT